MGLEVGTEQQCLKEEVDVICGFLDESPGDVPRYEKENVLWI